MSRKLSDDEQRLWAFVASDPHLKPLAGRVLPKTVFIPRPSGPYGPVNTPAPAAAPARCLDLHGLTADEAFVALETFLSEATGVHRQVSVITGRGHVLRQHVPRWVTHGALARWVLACRAADPQEGAFLLRLRACP